MSAGIYSLLCYQQLPDEELIKIYEKKVKIDELVHDGHMDYYTGVMHAFTVITPRRLLVCQDMTRH